MCRILLCSCIDLTWKCICDMQPNGVVGGSGVLCGGLSVVAYGQPVEEDFDIMEIEGPLLSTPRKRRARKLKEPLDSRFLRRSRRKQAEGVGCFNRDRAENAGEPSTMDPSPLKVVLPECGGSGSS